MTTSGSQKTRNPVLYPGVGVISLGGSARFSLSVSLGPGS